MKAYILIISVMILSFSCKSGEEEVTNNLQSDTHKIVVEEIYFTNNYTYLYGESDGKKIWVAASKMNAKVGDTFYYEGGMLMQNFVSKELNKTFEEIWFLDNIRTTEEKAQSNDMIENIPHDMKPKVEKKEVKLTAVEGGITISELFSKRKEYEGKVVIIKGVVAKFNPEIMKKNWIHIQDGTEYDGEFDLTVTSQSEVKVGDTITVEGKIALNKDFGYGYSYDIIMEEAVIK